MSKNMCFKTAYKQFFFWGGDQNENVKWAV